MLWVSVPHRIVGCFTDNTICLAWWKQARSHCKSNSNMDSLNKACVSQGLILILQHFTVPFQNLTLTLSTASRNPAWWAREGASLPMRPSPQFQAICLKYFLLVTCWGVLHSLVTFLQSPSKSELSHSVAWKQYYCLTFPCLPRIYRLSDVSKLIL